MNPEYHIFYRPKGQRSSELHSITPERYDDHGHKIGFASGAFVRGLWSTMLKSANRTGLMLHPDSGVSIEFATLQHAGHTDGNGNGQGGMLCQSWSVEHGLKKVYEPEPEKYSPRIQPDPVPEYSVPDQPVPVSFSPEIEESLPSAAVVETPAKKSKKRIEPKIEESVSVN